MKSNETIVLVLTIFSIATGYANAHLSAASKVLWLIAFSAVSVTVWDAQATEYWNSLEALFIASAAILTVKETYLHDCLVVLAAAHTLTNEYAAYIGVSTTTTTTITINSLTITINSLTIND